MYDSPSKKKKLRTIIRESRDVSSNLTQTEADILELVFHYEFYYLKNLPSPKFKKHTEEFYIEKIKSFLDSEEKICSCEIPLSSLINKEKVRMIRLIKRIEKHHESK